MNEPGLTFNRRQLINSAVVAGTASLLATESAHSKSESLRVRIIDTNVSLCQWPFRRLPLDETAALVGKLRELGISQAWAGSFEGVLHRDISGVNQRLAEQCAPFPELVPIGSINPALPGWKEDLRRCRDHHAMPGIRLYPNYHEYTLGDPRFTDLLQLATDAGLFVQIAVAMEDTRTQHELVQVSNVDLSPLPDRMHNITGARVQLLNARLRPPLLADLGKTPGIFFETSRVEGTDGVATLLRSVPVKRVMLGTHAPFLIPEATLIRIQESQLNEHALSLLLSENAEQQLTKPRR